MKLDVQDTSKSAALRQLRDAGYPIAGLLSSPESNPKVAKNSKMGVLTSPLHLSPFDLSGWQVCPMASKGCAEACLHTAGNPAYMAQKEQSRLLKTTAYFKHRELFLALLIKEVASLEKKAKQLGYQSGVRLNATSDIPWERVSYRYGDINYSNIMEQFPDTEWYDYTKRPNRKSLPSNYSLTFSLAEDNDANAAVALENGMNVAVVFDVKRGSPLPSFFELEGRVYPVIDGDEHDFRPVDPKGVIVGLRAKGDARGDTSGFVRSPDYALQQMLEAA